MRLLPLGVLSAAIGIGVMGCAGEVTPTDDSTKIEVEVPKVEIGEEKTDFDPRTDKDVDIDTPLPGDK